VKASRVVMLESLRLPQRKKRLIWAYLIATIEEAEAEAELIVQIVPQAMIGLCLQTVVLLCGKYCRLAARRVGFSVVMCT
jgi:hypothetical protein